MNRGMPKYQIYGSVGEAGDGNYSAAFSHQTLFLKWQLLLSQIIPIVTMKRFG